MMFIKFVKFDIDNGIIKHWRQILLTLLFSFLAGILHLLSLRVYELIHPEYLELRPLTGDFLITIFGGCKSNDIQEAGIAFQVPFLWMAYVCWMLFLVLRYPLEELEGIGKHQLVLSGRRSLWWFSKCIWICLEIVVSFIAVYIGNFLAGLFVNTKCSFLVNSYMVDELNFSRIGLVSLPWNIIGLLVSNICILMAITIAQMLLSLYIKPMYAYLLMVAYLLSSTYFDTPFFLGNYMMGARSNCFFESGYDCSMGCIVGLWLASLISIVGWCCFEKYDILGQG